MNEKRDIDTVLIVLTTRCSRKCKHCAFPWDYTWDANKEYIGWLTESIGKVDHIQITGGEPSENPDFEELVPALQQMAETVEAERLTIFTGRYHPLLTKFSTVFVSEYADNAEDLEKILSENKEVIHGAPSHIPADGNTGEGKMCNRADIKMVSVFKGQMYPCCGAPAYAEAPSLKLYPGIDWRVEIAKTPFYCANCRFSGTG